MGHEQPLSDLVVQPISSDLEGVTVAEMWDQDRCWLKLGCHLAFLTSRHF